MGLHQKTREYLFKEFISKNYSGTKKNIKTELLKINPDELLLNKKLLDRYLNISNTIASLLIGFEKKKEKNIFSIISSNLENIDLAYYKNSKAGYKLILETSENSQSQKYPQKILPLPKTIKDIILKKCENRTVSKIADEEWSRLLYKEMGKGDIVFYGEENSEIKLLLVVKGQDQSQDELALLEPVFKILTTMLLSSMRKKRLKKKKKVVTLKNEVETEDSSENISKS